MTRRRCGGWRRSRAARRRRSSARRSPVRRARRTHGGCAPRGSVVETVLRSRATPTRSCAGSSGDRGADRRCRRALRRGGRQRPRPLGDRLDTAAVAGRACRLGVHGGRGRPPGPDASGNRRRAGAAGGPRGDVRRPGAGPRWPEGGSGDLRALPRPRARARGRLDRGARRALVDPHACDVRPATLPCRHRAGWEGVYAASVRRRIDQPRHGECIPGRVPRRTRRRPMSEPGAAALARDLVECDQFAVSSR